MTESILLIAIRGMQMLLLTGIAGMCIFLGFRLFDHSIRTVDELRIESKDISVVVKNFGPGIAFALFGVLLLAISVRQTMTVQSSGPTGSMGGSMSGTFADRPSPVPIEKPRAIRAIKSINQALDILSRAPILTEREQSALKEASTGLAEIRSREIDVIYGEGASIKYIQWDKHATEADFLGSLLPEDRNIYSNIKDLMEEK